MTTSQPEHPQIDVDGHLIDVEIADLMRAVWRLGWTTGSSCQGDESDEPMMASIGFTDVDDALEALAVLRPLVAASDNPHREVTLTIGGPCCESNCTCEMSAPESALLAWWPREVTPHFARALAERVEENA